MAMTSADLADAPIRRRRPGPIDTAAELAEAERLREAASPRRIKELKAKLAAEQAEAEAKTARVTEELAEAEAKYVAARGAAVEAVEAALAAVQTSFDSWQDYHAVHFKAERAGVRGPRVANGRKFAHAATLADLLKKSW